MLVPRYNQNQRLAIIAAENLKANKTQYYYTHTLALKIPSTAHVKNGHRAA